MQIVTLKVQVDNAQLTKLQADVEALQGKTIKISAGEATDGVRKYSETVQDAAKNTESLFEKVGKFTQWYYIAGAVSAATGAMRDALDTMKDVDSELVTIRKVTGTTGEELAKIEEQAYKTASAYGVAANEYLESVAAFSRAGYGEQAQALAELATKTQIVGDTNQETANQFLLSVDAAYKYKGNIDELTKVLDGANEIDNKYATSIEKIAEGLGTVAPVAAQAHVGVDELTAAIGTITAVTQRSGSEAARAFRALVLNILGDTKTEIDEGVTWTTGEIANLRDVVKTYAPAAYEAAQATGKLIDPMEAIGGLAQAMKEGTLSEQKLMEMVSDIGGKLRTSQLLALIENWDMYKSMLNDFANAAGSADKEVSNALNSWERKTEVLKNTWAEFVSHLIETDAIKGGLDIVTGAINVLDSDFGRLAVTVGVTTGAVKLFSAGLQAAKGTEFLMLLQGLISGGANAAASLSLITETLAASPVAWAAAISGGVMLLGELSDAINLTSKEAQENLHNATAAVEENQRAIEELGEKAVETLSEGGQIAYRTLSEGNGWLQNRNELYQLIEKGLENLSPKERAYYEALIAENEALQEQERLAANRAVQALAGEAYSVSGADTVGSGLGVGRADVETQQEHVEGLLNSVQSLNELLPESRAEVSDFVMQLLESKDAGANLGDELDALVERYLNLADSQDQEADAIEAAAEASEYAADTLGYNAELIKELNDQIDETQSALSVLAAAQDEYNQNGELSIDTLQQLLSLDGEYLAAIYNESGALDLNGDAVNNLLTDKSKLLESLAAEAVANYAAEEANRLLAEQEGNAGAAADGASGSLQAAAAAALAVGDNSAKASVGVRQLSQELANLYGGKLTAANMNTLQSNVAGFADSVRSMIRSASSGLGSWTGSSYKSSGGGSRRSGGGGSGSRSGGGSGRGTNPEKERLEAEKKQLQKEKKELQKQRDAALKQNDIEKKKAQAQRDAEVDAIEKQLKELERQHKEQEETNKLAKLQLEVEKAELALMNVQNERTVRYYNAATGHWEWIAKNTDVIKAEQSLEDARKKLADEEAQQSYNNQLQSLKDQRDNVKSFWDETIKALQTQREGLQDYWKNAIARLDDTIDTLQEKLSNLNTTITVNVGGDGGGSSTSVAPSGSGDAPKSGAGVTALQNYLIRHFGMQLTADGVYGSATRNAVRKLQGYLGLSQDGYYGSGTAAAARNKYGYSDTPAAVYDAGGILHGLGGIKATRDDEIILPPAQTRDILQPSQDSAYRKALARMDAVFSRSDESVLPPEISQRLLSPVDNAHFERALSGRGYLYGQEFPQTTNFSTALDKSSRREINYNFGGLTITQQQADSMTVSQFVDFVKSSHNLGLHKWDK